MSRQSNNQAIATKGVKRLGKHGGDGVVLNAQHDADVIQMVSAELDHRAAALREKIAEAAYFRAEKRGFAAGHELEDWLAAEEEVVLGLRHPESAARTSESRSES